MKFEQLILSRPYLKDVMTAPIEIIPSDWITQIRFLSWTLLIGEPLYYLTWHLWLPEPRESLLLRTAAALLAVPMVIPWVHKTVHRRYLEWHWLVMALVGLPLSFLALYRMNAYDHVWMASCVAMIYILFYVTDWRLALGLLGLAVALVAGAEQVGLLAPAFPVAALPGRSAMVIFAIAIVTAMMMSWSSLNLRRERMRAALVTIGVLAHEFRTPLASASLMIEVSRPPVSEERLNAAQTKLNEIVRSLNAMIDYQLGNARLLEVPREFEPVNIGAAIADAISDYPLPCPALRRLISLDCDKKLYALIHPALLRQVIHNLLANAIKAVQATGRPFSYGDIAARVTSGAPGGHDLHSDPGQGRGHRTAAAGSSVRAISHVLPDALSRHWTGDVQEHHHGIRRRHLVHLCGRPRFRIPHRAAPNIHAPAHQPVA